MGLETILAGCAAILTAAGGIALVVREFRRRDRRASQRQLDDLVRELALLQHDYIELRKFMVQVSELLIDRGIEPPPMPPPH